MDCRYEQFDFADPVFGVFQQFRPYLGLIQPGIPCAYLFPGSLDPRMGFEPIIIAGPSLTKDFIHGPTSVATKNLLIKTDRYFATILPAMITVI
jgi:hypothetical protein